MPQPIPSFLQLMQLHTGVAMGRLNRSDRVQVDIKLSCHHVRALDIALVSNSYSLISRLARCQSGKVGHSVGCRNQYQSASDWCRDNRRPMQSFPKVTLIAVGKIKKRWIQDGIEQYVKRLPELTVVEIKDSTPDGEASKVLTYVKGGDRLVVLTEEGTSYTSVQLASMLAKADSGALIFLIGGPDGIAASLKVQAHQLLSLSAMTFPHELARLMLVEQLYRAKTIHQNSSYHR